MPAVFSGLRGFTSEVLPQRSDLRGLTSEAAQALDRFTTGEKLAPVLSMFTVDGEDEGLRLCQALLSIAGAGHTAVIHSANAARIERFARVIPAGRILVNSPAAQGCCGMTTGLACSMTLGCGTFGGNSTTDNITFRHLLNVKRVAYPIEVIDMTRTDRVLGYIGLFLIGVIGAVADRLRLGERSDTMATHSASPAPWRRTLSSPSIVSGSIPPADSSTENRAPSR